MAGCNNFPNNPVPDEIFDTGAGQKFRWDGEKWVVYVDPVRHEELDNILPDDHHPQFHSLTSHTDVTLDAGNKGDGLWWDPVDMQWKNRASATEAWPTGLVNGGELNIGPGVNDIEVIAGLGVTVDSYTTPIAPSALLGLEWPTLNEPITAAPQVAGSIVWFTIGDTGVPTGSAAADIQINVGEIRQYAQPPSPQLQRSEIALGLVIHDGVTWKEVSSPKVINQTAETLRELLVNVMNPTTIISGGTVLEQPGFMLDQEAGVVWENNRNWHVDKSDPNREVLPAASPMVFQYVNRDFTTVGLDISTVDSGQWDNAGVVEAVPNPAFNATIQRVYLDPSNHYWILWGQTVYPNFLTAQANLPADNVVVPFLLQNSLLLGYIIAGKNTVDWDVDGAVFNAAGTGAGSGGGGTPITEHANLNGITHSDHHPRLVWEPVYTEGPTWLIGTLVANSSFISIANIDTLEPAFPSEIGDLVEIYPELPPFLDADNISMVRSGYFVEILVPGEIRMVQVWVPEITNDTNYTLVTVLDPNGPAPILDRTVLRNENLTANQWNVVSAGSQLFAAGSEILIYLESQNFGATTVVTGGWGYDGTSNNAAPVANRWNSNIAKTLVRVDKTDLDTVDRSGELLGIIAGATLQFAETASPTNAQIYTVLSDPIDGGTYIQYSVSLSSETGSIPVAAVTTMTADVPVSQATKFVYLDGQFTVQPSVATFTSFLQYGDFTQVVPDDIGYGINLNFQQLQQSDDWDLILLGGGGGGGGDFTPSLFTGAGTTGYVPDPVTENGLFLRDDGSWAAADLNPDGGAPDSVYTAPQRIDGEGP